METKASLENIIALIVAGGSGQRFDQSLPKQFHMLNNKTILEHTIARFANHPLITNTLVVLPDNFIETYYTPLQQKYKLTNAITGGKKRQESVFNGLKIAQNFNPSHILIHDAARPLVSVDLISNICHKLLTCDATYPALPISDTIRKIDGFQSQTIDRETHYIVQTPQAFVFEKIFSAHNSFPHLNFTDDVALAEMSHMKICKIDGCKKNLKITTQHDFDLVEFFLTRPTNKAA